MALSLHSVAAGSTAAALSSSRLSALRTKSRVKCCITGCNNREGDPGFSFHRFPTDAAMRSQWIAAINQSGFCASQSTRICSRHFTRQSFVAKAEGRPRHPKSRMRLYPNALPSMFNCSTLGGLGQRSVAPVQYRTEKPQATASSALLGVVPIRRISLLSDAASVEDSASQQQVDECYSTEVDSHDGQPSSSQHNPTAVATSRRGPEEFALLNQIVRVALDVDDAQGHLLRELGRLGRRQKRQEALLDQLVGQLTHLVDPESGPPSKRSADADCSDQLEDYQEGLEA